MVANWNKVLSKFWVLWLFLKKRNKINWQDFLKKFGEFDNLSLKIKEIILEINKQPSLFEENEFNINDFEEKALEIENKWAAESIRSIAREDFKKLPAIANVKANWFFYKGDVSVLENKPENFVAAIGSRKTPEHYKEWIGEVLPKDKIVVSGLAIGADTMAHTIAMNRKQKIVVFPGLDIYKLRFKDPEREAILKYAENQGIILSDIFPGSNSFDETNFLKRNKWMAQMSSITFVVYFQDISGTIGQMVESLKLDKKIILPAEVLDSNKKLFNTHKGFKNWEKCIESRQ